LRHAGGRAGQTIEVAFGFNLLPATEVFDGPVLGATTFADALDQVE
jgi:hypothetical protein